MITTKLFILASAITLTLAFKSHQPAIPLTRNDTDKPKANITELKFTKRSLRVPEPESIEWDGSHMFYINRSLYRSEVKCYDYKSPYGYKPCGGSWVIKDTMGLIYSLYEMLAHRNGTYSTGSPITSDADFRFTPHPSPIPDTTVKPAYQYFYHVRIPINRFNPPLDTIQLVMNRMGESMSVDRANELRTILFTQINYLLGRPVLDSVKIEK